MEKCLTENPSLSLKTLTENLQVEIAFEIVVITVLVSEKSFEPHGYGSADMSSPRWDTPSLNGGRRHLE